MLELLLNFFNPRPKPVIRPKIKSEFQLFLEKHKYDQGSDILILPQTYLARSDINPNKHLIIYINTLLVPAIIKS